MPVVAANFACQFALIAFAVAELRGVMLGGDFPAATKIAFLAGLLFFLLGLVIGELARRLAEESARYEFAKLAGQHEDHSRQESR